MTTKEQLFIESRDRTKLALRFFESSLEGRERPHFRAGITNLRTALEKAEELEKLNSEPPPLNYAKN